MEIYELLQIMKNGQIAKCKYKSQVWKVKMDMGSLWHLEDGEMYKIVELSENSLSANYEIINE